MNRLRAPFGLLFAMVALVSGCGAAAELPVPDQRQFVDQLTWMMFGDKDEVEVSPGYRLAGLVVLEGADLARIAPSSQVDASALRTVFEPLDALYRGNGNTTPNAVQIHALMPGATAERLVWARQVFESTAGQPHQPDLRRNSTALSILTYQDERSDEVRRRAASLHHSRRTSILKLSRTCELAISKDEYGYVKSVVGTVLLPSSGEFIVDSPSGFDCILAAQIYGAGLSDAVVTGRFRAFPTAEAQLDGCIIINPARRQMPQGAACRSPLTGMAKYAVLSHLIGSGKLRPGRLQRDSFQAMVRELIALPEFVDLIGAYEERERRLTRSFANQRILSSPN